MINYLTSKFNTSSKPNLRLIVVLLACFYGNVSFADHYYGGYFYYETVGDKTVKVSLVTYTDFHNDDSDRQFIAFEWGDGESTLLERDNNGNQGEELYLGMKKNVYVGTHEYESYANYQLYFSDHYRLNDVNNMAVGASGSINLRFDGLVPVNDSNVYCINDSPVPLVDPYFYGKEGQEFQLNFGYFDNQGDSMTYTLVDCKGAQGESADDYFIPSDASIDPRTGQFKWVSPKKGRYCFSFEVGEYRNGQLMGKSSTDFTLFISLQDYPSLDKGTFVGPSPGEYTFSGAESKDFIVAYSHPLADSIQLNLLTPLSNYLSFSLSQKTGLNATAVADTMTVTFDGDHSFNGFEPLVWQFEAYFGEDSVLNEVRTVGIGLENDVEWGCEIPDLSEIFELAPNIPTLTISPNLFDESVWINVGSNYESMTMNIFDLRGRMVRSYFNLSGPTVKLQLDDLSSAMYILQVLEDGKEIHVGKMIKR